MQILLGCHGIPERCLKWKGKPMKICSRCFGGTIGHILSIPYIMLGGELFHIVFISFIALMVIDGLIQMYLGIKSNNLRRIITGLLAGFAMGSYVWYIIFAIIKILTHLQWKIFY